MITIEVINYTTISGKVPFEEWLEKLDINIRATIRSRIARVRLGNFGVCRPIKGAPGIAELIFDFGPGYRVYFGKEGESIVILLIGGIKRSQSQDIEKAKRYWSDYRGRSYGKKKTQKI